MIAKNRKSENLIKEIQAWDGKSSDYISEIYYRHYQETFFAVELTASIKVSDLQKGATWLLKKYLEEKGKLTSREITEIYTMLPELNHWEAKLHILQCISYMPIKAAFKKKVEKFLRECLLDHNKFLRAWSYNGLYELASQHQEYRDEVKALLEKALEDESASVKARVRKAMKRHVWK